jgi:hypothetical protein
MGSESACVITRREGQVGGASRDRTDDLLLAKQALSQLSYGPKRRSPKQIGEPEGRRVESGGPGKT